MLRMYPSFRVPTEKSSMESALTPAPLLRAACRMVPHMLPGRE